MVELPENLPESLIVDIYCRMDSTLVGGLCEFQKGEVRTADGRQFKGYFIIAELEEVNDEAEEDLSD